MPSRHSKFSLGSQPPPFVLPYDEDRTFSLQEEIGRGFLLLGFIRGTWCPFCRRFMRLVLETWKQFQSLNCEVVLVASQPLPPILHFVRQEKLPFKILADADRKVTRAYGVYQPLGLMGVNVARPSTFLLDEQGRIIYQYIGSATNRPPIPEILQILESAAKDRKSKPKARSLSVGHK